MATKVNPLREQNGSASQVRVQGHYTAALADANQLTRFDSATPCWLWSS